MDEEYSYNKIGTQNRKNDTIKSLNIAENSTDDAKPQIFTVIKYIEKKRNLKVNKGKIFEIKKQIIVLNKKENTIRHTNQDCDNMSRKIKSWVIDYVRKIINKKIKDKEAKKQARKKNNYYLYIIKKSQAYSIKINDNSNLLVKKVEDILSEDISKKIKGINIKINIDHNKKIIQKIKENEEYSDIIEILQLEFLDCIKNFMGKKEIECIKGFENNGYISKKKLLKDDESKSRFESFVNNIEKYYKDKPFRIEMNKKTI